MIDFDHWMHEFTLNLQEISDKEVEFTTYFKTLYTEIKNYLPTNNKIFEAFQILDSKSRHLPNIQTLFRELLKLFWRCYDHLEHNITQPYLKCNSNQLHLSDFEKNHNFMLKNLDIYLFIYNGGSYSLQEQQNKIRMNMFNFGMTKI